jgi:hypothetical protein
VGAWVRGCVSGWVGEWVHVCVQSGSQLTGQGVVLHRTLPRQCGKFPVQLAWYVTQVAPLLRTGHRFDRGQLRFSSPRALAMQLDVGHSLCAHQGVSSRVGAG